MASIENKAKECTSLSSSSYPKKYESCYVSYKNTKVSCSLRASSPGRSGGKAEKGRKPYNYVSGI